MRRLRQQRGLALTELLMAVSLMGVIMSATLLALSQFEGNTNRNIKQNEAQDEARNATDLIVRQLRNHASPTPQDPRGIERATSTDLIFQTVDQTAPGSGSANTHNIARVRYCLDSSNPANEKLWAQRQFWTAATAPAVPNSTSCPDDAWGNQRLMADHVVNYNGQSRALFTIDCAPVFTSAQCDAGTDPALLAAVRRLEIDLYVDADPAKQPKETRLATAVYFRNQNAAPTASFTVQSNPGRHLLLNASGSSDPDGDRLFYTWSDGDTVLSGRTVVVDYVAPTEAARTITLKVTDTGGLTATYSIPVTVEP